MIITREYLPTTEQLQKIKSADYGEVNYIDRRVDGTNAGEGTEDFSFTRWIKCTVRRYVYLPTGNLDKGGHRRWEYDSCIIARTVKECGIIARLRYAGKEISIRTY